MASAPAGLAVLLDEKRVNDLLEQQSGARALVRQSCNVLLFMLFVALYTVLALGEPIGRQRAFEGYLRRLFDEGAPMPLREVESASTFWQYTHNTFLPGLYGENTEKYYYPGHEIETLMSMEGGNRLFGVVRLRMLKVKENLRCKVPETFTTDFGSCFGPYHEQAEDDEAFGPVADDGQADFRYYRMPSGQRFLGQVATYSNNGFMKILTGDYDRAFRMMALLEENDFVTQATRAIFFEFTIFNFNLGLYAPCRISFEVAPSGLWSKTFEVNVLLQRHFSALGFGTTLEWLLLVGEAVLVLFVLRYFMEEASELRGSAQKLAYFKDAWNFLDWVNLILIIITFWYRISTWSLAGGLQVYLGPPEKQDLQAFTDLSEVSENVRLIRGLQAFNAVLTWFKTVKYYNVVPDITIFMHTVVMSQRMLFSFAIIFIACFFGFVLAYSVAFGESLPAFRTVGRAVLFLMRSFLGDGDMSGVIESGPTTGPLLMVLFVLGMLFIMMNLFAAIMIRALADAKREQDAKMAKRWELFVDRAHTLYNVLWNSLRMETTLRSCVPGLYTRCMNRKKKQQELENKRDVALFAKQQAKRPDDLLALGPGSPTCGRRQKRALASVAVKDGDSDDGSEADLGPLFAAEQLKTISNSDGPSSGHGGGRVGGLPTLGYGQAVGSETVTEDDAEAIDLILQATSYVASGVVERTRGARGVLFREMADSREVLVGMSAVVEVLSRRARDLEAQQAQMLRNL